MQTEVPITLRKSSMADADNSETDAVSFMESLLAQQDEAIAGLDELDGMILGVIDTLAAERAKALAAEQPEIFEVGDSIRRAA